MIGWLEQINNKKIHPLFAPLHTITTVIVCKIGNHICKMLLCDRHAEWHKRTHFIRFLYYIHIYIGIRQ